MALLDPDPAFVERGNRLRERMSLEAWPAYARPANPLGFCKAAAPLLPVLFATAKKEGDLVRLRSPDLPSVLLDGDTWKWRTEIGCAEGRGIIALWAWRWDITPQRAHMEIMALLDRMQPPPKRKARAA